MTRFVLLLLCAAALGACRNTGDTGPKGDGPWAPTTHAFDPACTDCKEIGSGESAHAGEVRWLVDATTDDPPAQWGRCMFSFMRCADRGGEYRDCVSSALCPEACKAEFARVLGSSTDLEDEVQAVEQTFLTDGALCAAPDENPTVSP